MGQYVCLVVIEGINVAVCVSSCDTCHGAASQHVMEEWGLMFSFTLKQYLISHKQKLDCQIWTKALSKCHSLNTTYFVLNACMPSQAYLNSVHKLT